MSNVMPTQTIETRCVRCGVTLVWTALFCRSAPKWFSYFDCGRHRIRDSSPIPVSTDHGESEDSQRDEETVTIYELRHWIVSFALDHPECAESVDALADFIDQQRAKPS